MQSTHHYNIRIRVDCDPGDLEAIRLDLNDVAEDISNYWAPGVSVTATLEPATKDTP